MICFSGTFGVLSTNLKAFGVLVLMSCFVRAVFEFMQFAHHLQEYFLNMSNYIEVILYICLVIFVGYDFHQLVCLPSWQWQLGAVCMFLIGFNLVLILHQNFIFGIYVVMFQNIFKTFICVIPTALLLIMAFSQPFFMLLSVVETTVNHFFFGSHYTLSLLVYDKIYLNLFFFCRSLHSNIYPFHTLF